MFCVNCGYKLEDNWYFCPACTSARENIPDDFSDEAAPAEVAAPTEVANNNAVKGKRRRYRPSDQVLFILFFICLTISLMLNRVGISSAFQNILESTSYHEVQADPYGFVGDGALLLSIIILIIALKLYPKSIVIKFMFWIFFTGFSAVCFYVAIYALVAVVVK